MYAEQILDDLDNKNPRTEVTDRPWTGFINSTPASEEDMLMVIIPGIDSEYNHGPCFWSPRPGTTAPILPSEGDKCLVIFDDDKRPWVIEWWPYA